MGSAEWIILDGKKYTYKKEKELKFTFIIFSMKI